MKPLIIWMPKIHIRMGGKLFTLKFCQILFVYNSLFAQSFWNFTQFRTAILPRFVQNDCATWIKHYWACDYLSMLGLKLIYVSKRGPWCMFRFSHMSFDLCRNSRYGNKTVEKVSYFHCGFQVTVKTTSLYWNGTLRIISKIYQHNA